MENQDSSLGEVALSYLTSLPPQESQQNQREVNKFVLWYGKERPVGQITPREIEVYAAWAASATSDAAKRLQPVRQFLTYLKKEKFVQTSLATHLRIKQAATKATLRAKPKQQVILTPEDYAKLKAQLAALEKDRMNIAEELRRAAADKDFRENAPLQAAREQRDYIEARIREIQTALSTGTPVEQAQPTEEAVARIGSKVVLCDTTSGVRLTYTLVTKNDANPARSKISIASPIGRACLNQRQGEVIKVVAPAGELSYQIESVE